VPPVSLSLHAGTLAASKARTGKRASPAYTEALTQRQLRPEPLHELLTEAEAEHGPADPATVEAKPTLMRGDAAHPPGAARASHPCWTARACPNSYDAHPSSPNGSPRPRPRTRASSPARSPSSKPATPGRTRHASTTPSPG